MSDFNIIIMRDRGKSYSFRFSPATFRIIVSSLIIVPILFVVSVWFGLSTFNKYVSLLEETAAFKHTIEQHKQTVARLANLERFLQKYSPNMLGLLVPTDTVDIDALPVIDGDKNILMSDFANSIAGSPMSFDIIEKDDEKESAGEKNGENAEQKLTAEINSQEKTMKEAEEIKEEVQSVKEDTKKETEEITAAGEERPSLQKIDLGYVEIEALKARVAAQNVNISYRLKNLGRKAFLQGVQKYYVSSQMNGKMVQQELPKATDNSFRIKNLKNVSSTASLAGIQIGQKAQLVLEIVVDGEVVFRQFYPLAR
jgi:Uncharacterized protein conserved in bacteria